MNNNKQLKEGDNVVLKCGGPLMVIEIIKSDDSVRCVFFNRQEELQIIEAHPSAIMKATRNNLIALENEIKILNTEAPLGLNLLFFLLFLIILIRQKKSGLVKNL